MNDLVQRVRDLLVPSLPNLVRWIDILLVAFVVYRFLLLVRSTRAWRVMLGIVIFVVALFLSDYLQLNTLHWLLEKATLLGPVALVILFLPELRKTLESFARFSLVADTTLTPSTTIAAKTVEEIVAATSEMAAQRIGALIVIERGMQLEEVAGNGVSVNAEVSAPLLGSIFFGSNPLHDGAVLIRGDRILAAACRLPLSESPAVDKRVHMRHRAGLGISEQSDCVVVIVSEERGVISLALDGQLLRLSDAGELRNLLNAELRKMAEEKKARRRRRDKSEVAV